MDPRRCPGESTESVDFIIPAAAGPGYEGLPRRYRLVHSTDLLDWSDIADGTPLSHPIPTGNDRGFDMFWIAGGSSLAKSLAILTGWAWLAWFTGQMHHPEWIGFTVWDLIFPLFLFLAGVAMPYSLGRRLEAGVPKWKLLRKVAVRVLLLL